MAENQQVYGSEHNGSQGRWERGSAKHKKGIALHWLPRSRKVVILLFFTLHNKTDLLQDLPGGPVVKNPLDSAGMQVWSLVRKWGSHMP